VGDRVEKGEPLFRIYAAESSHYDLALAAAHEENGFALGVTGGETA
jgi:thymidine phosphorylase